MRIKIKKLRVAAFLITRYFRAPRTKIRLKSMNHVGAKFRRNAKAPRPEVREKKTREVRKDREEKEQKRQREKKEQTRGGIRKRRSAAAHLRIVMLTPAREVTIGTKHNGEIPAEKGAREVVEAESKGWEGTRAGKRYRIIVLRRLVAGTRSALT